MKFIHYKSQSPSHDEDELDRLLDTTLAKYSAVDPRPGLNERILANLRSPEQPMTSAWWRWGVAVALAVVLIGSAVEWRSIRPHSEIANHPIPGLQIPTGNASRAAHDYSPHDLGVNRHPDPVHQVATRSSRAKPGTMQTPKLEQFPSPHPLSEQEQMLALYVEQFNDEAVIVARVRTEALRLDREKEMREAEQTSNQDPQAR